MSESQLFGNRGEQLAYQYLISHGVDVIDRNVRVGSGEIDIVAKENDCVVFVEVKTRHESSFADPEASITMLRAERMIACAEEFMQLNPEFGESYRIDLISITKNTRSATANIVWFKNAISG